MGSSFIAGQGPGKGEYINEQMACTLVEITFEVREQISFSWLIDARKKMKQSYGYGTRYLQLHGNSNHPVPRLSGLGSHFAHNAMICWGSA